MAGRDNNNQGSNTFSPLVVNVGSAMISGSIAAGMFNGLDTLRVRYQLVGILPDNPKKNTTSGITVWRYGLQICRNEGFLKGLFYPGLTANIAAVAIREPIRSGCYPIVRDTLSALSSDGRKNHTIMFSSGFLCGLIGYFLCAPLFQAKTALNAQASLEAAGNPSRYKGLTNYMSQTYKGEGVRGLWRGAGFLVIRGSMLTAGQWLGYDGLKTKAKQMQLLQDNAALHIMASVSGGFFATLFACPFDVAMTRWTTVRQSGIIYNSPMDCFIHIYRENGVRGFFKGWVPFFSRVGPLFVVMLPLFEATRNMLGLGYLD
eukprot:m.46800 g.46800  ORF g.46800 m.46800 type:complete len:317 (-) comp10409_c0_seq1:1037-1987(-)